jgi:hypothetical protein
MIIRRNDVVGDGRSLFYGTVQNLTERTVKITNIPSQDNI